MFTKGAFATIQWTCLMQQLLDIHPPPKLNVDGSFSESSCSAVPPRIFHAISDVFKTQRDFESVPLEEKPEEYASGNPTQE